MGMHEIKITMVGWHGCDRLAKEGEPIKSCGHPQCPDCAARAFVEELKVKMPHALGFDGCGATFTHWPGERAEVIDDLVSGKRIKGSFG